MFLFQKYKEKEDSQNQKWDFHAWSKTEGGIGALEHFCEKKTTSPDSEDRKNSVSVIY